MRIEYASGCNQAETRRLAIHIKVGDSRFGGWTLKTQICPDSSQDAVTAAGPINTKTTRLQPRWLASCMGFVWEHTRVCSARVDSHLTLHGGQWWRVGGLLAETVFVATVGMDPTSPGAKGGAR